jgi:hypothetical protein
MKNFLQHTIRIIAIVFFMTLFSGCFMFHKKNRCGDCPKWKVELKAFLSAISE